MLQKLNFRQVWLVLGAGLLLAIVAGSLVPVPKTSFQVNDKLIHVALYFMLMAWFSQVFISRYRFLLAVIFISLGFLLEVGQQFTDYRSFEWSDVVANSAGVLLGWISMHTVLGKTVFFIDTLLARLVSRSG